MNQETEDGLEHVNGVSEVVVEDKGVVGGTAGKEEHPQFARSHPPLIQLRRLQRMLKHLTGPKNQLILGEFLSGKIPSSNLLFYVFYPTNVEIKLPVPVSCRPARTSVTHTDLEILQ